MTNAQVTVFGEALIDLLKRPDGTYEPVPGGSPSNTATALARRGVPTALLARLADDEWGKVLRASLEKSRIDLSFVARSTAPTTLAVVSFDGLMNATYSFYVEGCADGTWTIDDLPLTLGDSSFLAFSGSLALATKSMADAVDHLLLTRNNDLIVVFDPNIRPSLATDRDRVIQRMDRWIEQSTILKISTEDIAWRWPGRAPEQVADELAESGVPLVAVTDGPAGAFARFGSEAMWFAAPHVKVADTVGAGDTFTAALIEWLITKGVDTRRKIDLLDRDQITEALAHAVRLASDTCTRTGADPPWR